MGSAIAPDQYLEMQLEDDADENMDKLRSFLHCPGNFSMVHANQNTHHAVTSFADRHIAKLTSKSQLARKYHRFKHEMGYARTKPKSNLTIVSRVELEMNQTIFNRSNE